jgi:hypothetical protein
MEPVLSGNLLFAGLNFNNGKENKNLVKKKKSNVL